MNVRGLSSLSVNRFINIIFFIFLFVIVFFDFNSFKPYFFLIMLFFVFLLYSAGFGLSIRKTLLIMSLIIFLILQCLLFYDNVVFNLDFKYYLNNFCALIVLFLILESKTNDINYSLVSRSIVILNFFYYFYCFSTGSNGLSYYAPEKIPEYINYRVFGPSFYLSAFLLLLTKEKNFGFYLLILVSAIIKGSGQELSLILCISWYYIYCKNKIFSLTLGSISLCALFFYITNKGSDYLYIKMLSFGTRLDDLRYLTQHFSMSEYNSWFGNGIGVRSEVVRYSPFSRGIVESRTFLEIDNGFYYIFHRFGLIGLFFSIVGLLYLFFKSPRHVKIIPLFLIITMGLSITLITSVTIFITVFWVYYVCKEKN